VPVAGIAFAGDRGHDLKRIRDLLNNIYCKQIPTRWKQLKVAGRSWSAEIVFFLLSVREILL